MAILLFCTAACSDSYLELSPESSVSDEVIFENADAAQYAVNGLGRIMSTQYLDTQGYNGEGTVYAYQGEYPGDVIQKGSYMAGRISRKATILPAVRTATSM